MLMEQAQIIIFKFFILIYVEV